MKILPYILILIFSTGVVAQKYEVDPSQSSILILGTSSLHDWESEVKNYKVTLITGSENSLNVNIVSESIKSGKGIMDDKTYEALQSKKFPHIIFTSTNVLLDGNQITAKGILNLAGANNEITIQSDLVRQGDILKVTGEKKLKMTDFQIEPPTAMFGSLVTGDEVTIQFELELKPFFTYK